MPEAQDGGAQILEYTVLEAAQAAPARARRGAGASANATRRRPLRLRRRLPVFAGFGFEQEVPGLAAGTQYCFTLAVRNNLGTSSASVRRAGCIPGERGAVRSPPGQSCLNLPLSCHGPTDNCRVRFWIWGEN